MMIDVDHFKRFNDNYGHKVGDLVLKHLAALMKDFFRQSGAFLARYGGEEFSVCIPGISQKQAVRLANEFCRLVETSPLTIRREEFKITVSIGLAAFPENAKIKDDLIMKADQALYEAKNAGRNKVWASL